jgi:hypothetical protein
LGAQVEFGVRLSLLGGLAYVVLGNDGALRRTQKQIK